MEFALGFVEDTGRHFLQEYLSRENRLRCKQLVFPNGILINQKNKVYTPEVSVFYRLATMKKDAEASDLALMVRQMDSRWNQFYTSLMLMYEKLDKLGLTFCDDGIVDT